MFLTLYSALLTLALVLTAPWWLWRMAATNRYRHGLTQRLGLISPTLRATVLQAQREHRRILWLHAVSVGEVLASVRLVAELETAAPDHLILISTTTLTGQHLAQQRFGSHRVFYLPLDFALPVRRYLRLLRPSALLLMESELWPRLLAECRRAHIPVAVLNARISDRSFPRYLCLRPLWRRIFANVTLFLAQGEETASRLLAIGATPTQIQTPGNLKFDLGEVKQSGVAAWIKDVAAGRPIIVAGSTLAGRKIADKNEDEMMIEALEEENGTSFPVLVVLAPRHPDRFWEAEQAASLKYLMKASEFQSGTKTISGFTERRYPPPAGLAGLTQVVLLDTIGDLAAVYSVATIAFIGGSLVPKGGHNPLEAARFGVPIVMGPSYENFREIVEGMKSANAIRITSPADLQSTLTELLQDDHGLGHNARLYFESQSGATARTIAALLPILPP